MPSPEDLDPHKLDVSPMARAYRWVGRIFAICLEMVLPCVFGHWLDRWIGWSFALMTILGAIVGLVFGMTHLVIMANADERKSS